LAKVDGNSEGLVPYGWYKGLVVAGARQNGLPEAYIERLARAASKQDQKDARPHKLEAEQLLKEFFGNDCER
jgi:gamma-glutamylcyclotransferase